MKIYQGNSQVKAIPMTRGEYNTLRRWETPVTENPAEEGYLVEDLVGARPNHPDFQGYITWSPKDMFDRAFFEVTDPKIPDEHPHVKFSDLLAMIDREEFTLLPDGRTTICTLYLKNGFTVNGQSACVSSENYRKQVGEHFSRKKAIDSLWPYAGFLLAEKLHQKKKLSTWQGRLEQEYEEIKERYEAIVKFLADPIKEMDPVSLGLLDKQKNVMADYLLVLKERKELIKENLNVD